MAKRLDVTFTPQSRIQVENLSQNTSNNNVPIGEITPQFAVPDIPQVSETEVQGDHPQALQIVAKINRYIENIADDYFLLGLHLIALHQMLRNSEMTTVQIKEWYLDKINMPYSSAMQCKKVAEVYEDNPRLIERYGASGAYLLTTLNSHEERETVWIQACGDKITASVASLRKELKQWHLTKALSTSKKKAVGRLHKNDRNVLKQLSTLIPHLKNLQNLLPDQQIVQRQKYAQQLRLLASQLEEDY